VVGAGDRGGSARFRKQVDEHVVGSGEARAWLLDAMKLGQAGETWVGAGWRRFSQLGRCSADARHPIVPYSDGVRPHAQSRRVSVRRYDLTSLSRGEAGAISHRPPAAVAKSAFQTICIGARLVEADRTVERPDAHVLARGSTPSQTCE